MNRIDKLICKAKRAAGEDLRVSSVTVTYTVDGWNVTACLWDGVPGSARGRDDWRITTVHATDVDAANYILELKKTYPSPRGIPVIVDTFCFGGNIYAYQV